MSAPSRYSFSLMQKAELCLLSAKFNRELNFGGPAATLGHLFHHAAEGALHAYLEGRTPVAGYMDALASYDGAVTLADHEQVLDWFQPWWGAMVMVEDPMLVLIEQSYEHPVAEHMLSARIDVIQLYKGDDGRLICRIDDHKTGRVMPSQEEFEKRLQTVLYAWHVSKEIPGIELFDVGEVYVRYGVRRSMVFGPEKFEGLEMYLIGAAGRLERAWKDDVFPATPGAHCAHCDAPQQCPVPEVPVLEDAEDAEATLDAVLIAEAQVKALKARLKGWVGENGEVMSGGMVARLRPESREMVDKDSLRHEIGDLTPFTRKSTYTKFEVVKAKPDP